MSPRTKSAKKAAPSNGKPGAAAKLSFPFSQSDDGIYETYADYVAANWTFFGVRIRFGQFLGSQETTTAQPTFRVEERVAMTMAWAEAKQLVTMVGELITRFEKVNGEIKLPKLPI